MNTDHNVGVSGEVNNQLKGVFSDERICEDDDFFVVDDIEPVVSGHKLVFTKRRYSCLAEAGVQQVITFLERLFLPTVSQDYWLLEHGRAKFCTSFNGCTHAHAHLIPCSEVDELHLPAIADNLTLFEALAELKLGSSYILWGKIGYGFAYAEPFVSDEKRIIRNAIRQAKQSGTRQ